MKEGAGDMMNDSFVVCLFRLCKSVVESGVGRNKGNKKQDVLKG